MTTSPMSGPGSAQVTEIEVDRERAVTVVFDDGFGARFDLLDLRRRCPCAGCQGAREQGRAIHPGDTVTVLDAELHGNWAISIRWSDGHDTGMYAWSYLRALAEATTSDAPAADGDADADAHGAYRSED